MGWLLKDRPEKTCEKGHTLPRREPINHMNRPPLLSRRKVLGGAVAGLCAITGKTAQAHQDLTAESGRLIVAGVADSQCGRWADILVPALAEALHVPPFTVTTTTGWDGVTGANLFDIQQEQAVPPAGLIVPGRAVLAAMCGDSRVHYDYQRWVPTFISHQPMVAVGRASLHRSLSSIIKGQPLRVAVSTYAGAELPTLLALDLLALRPLPVPGFGTPSAAIDALRAGTVEVIQLPFDGEYAGLMASLQEDGFEPLFANALPKDVFQHRGLPPDFTAIYTQERRHAPSSLEYDVWSATTAACAMKAGVMLPILSSPSQVALWRHACQTVASQQDMRSHARDENEVMVTGNACAAAYTLMMPDVSVLMALRRWLSLNIPKWRDTLARRSGPPAPQQNPN